MLQNSGRTAEMQPEKEKYGKCTKKPLIHVSKRVAGIYGKRGVGERLAEKVGKGLAKGWRRVGERLAKAGLVEGWRISLHPPISGFLRRPFRLGLLYLRLVFVTYGQLAWVFLLSVEIRFGLFCLRWKIGLVFCPYGSPRRGHCRRSPQEKRKKGKSGMVTVWAKPLAEMQPNAGQDDQRFTKGLAA